MQIRLEPVLRMDHNMDTPSLLSVCLIGHSFITRLERYMQSNIHLRYLNLDRDLFCMITRARGGEHVLQIGIADVLTQDVF